MIFEEVAMCQIVFSLGYYGFKNNKDKQMARHATESYGHNRYDFENSERDWRMIDAKDKYDTVCHDMSKSLLVIVSTEIRKVKILNRS